MDFFLRFVGFFVMWLWGWNTAVVFAHYQANQTTQNQTTQNQTTQNLNNVWVAALFSIAMFIGYLFITSGK